MTGYTPTTEVIREQWGNAVDYYRSPQQRLPLFDRWHAEEIRKAKEEAWDEREETFGLDLLKPLREDLTRDTTRNPYRKEQND